MPGIKYRISLEGGEQVSKELLTVEQAVKRLQNAAKTGAGADTFASTTAAISALGKTSDEAFTNAAAAAKKFGASSNELARVEGIIAALATRSKDGGIAFATLAQNYDKARGSLGAGGQAAAAAGAGLARTAVAAAETSVAVRGLNTALGLTRTQFGMMAQVAAVAGAGPLGRLVSAVGGAAAGFGGLAAAMAGVAVAGGTLFTFAKGAAESAKALEQLSQVSGQSFDSLSALQSAFGQLGVSAEVFTSTFSNLFQTLSAQAPQLALAYVGAADKATTAVNNFKQAQLGLMRAQITDSLARGYISAADAAQQLQGIQLANNKLAVESGEINQRNAQRALQSGLANNLQKVVEQIRQAVESGKELKFDALTEAATKADALKTRLLQVQVAGGSVAEELFKILRAMSAVDAANIGRAIGLPPEMITAIRHATINVEDLARALRASGQALSEVDSAPLRELDIAINKVSGDWQEFKNRLGVAVAPIFNDLLKQVINFGIGTIETFQAMSEAWKIFVTALKLSPLGLITGQTVSGIKDLFKIIEDSGKQGESATDKLIQKLGQLRDGIGTTQTAAEALKNKTKEAGDAGASVKPIADPFVAASKGADQFKAKMVAVARGIEDAMWNKAAFGGGTEAQMWDKAAFGGGIEAQMRGGAGGGGGAAATGGTEVFKQVEQSAQQTAQKVKQIFTDLGTSIVINVDFNPIISAAQTAATSITTAFSTIDISSALSAQIDVLVSKFAELARAAAAAASAAASAASGGGGGAPAPAPFARGGLFGGRGTGTSDSNLAWVSRGEHIMPARAVRQPGVLAFLEALRRSGGDLSRILDGMGRFALGGMVPQRMAIPAFAGGGPVGSMSNVTIQFPGVPPVGGLRASSEVVDQLHKAAALAQVRSGGRKPSRYS